MHIYWLTLILIGGTAMAKSPTLGIHEGSLNPCPDSPNCVSSGADPNDGEHYYQPLSIASLDQGRVLLKEIMLEMPRTNLIKEDGNYMHFEVRSRLFGFVDDVEVYFPEDGKSAHFRSASRTGYSDLGVNRKRIHQLVKTFQERSNNQK